MAMFWMTFYLLGMSLNGCGYILDNAICNIKQVKAVNWVYNVFWYTRYDVMRARDKMCATFTKHDNDNHGNQVKNMVNDGVVFKLYISHMRYTPCDFIYLFNNPNHFWGHRICKIDLLILVDNMDLVLSVTSSTNYCELVDTSNINWMCG